MSVLAYDASSALSVTRERTGVVIPVYLPTGRQGIDAEQGKVLVRETAQTYCAQVDDPSAICLSIDGEPFGAKVAQRLARERGVSVHVTKVRLRRSRASPPSPSSASVSGSGTSVTRITGDLS